MITPGPDATEVTLREGEYIVLGGYQICFDDGGGRVLRESAMKVVVHPSFSSWKGVLSEQTHLFHSRDTSYFSQKRGMAGQTIHETIELDNVQCRIDSHGRSHALKVRVRRASADCVASPHVNRAMKRARDLIE